MKTASVGEIQKNFSRILKEIKTGEEIAVTKRGKPVAKITALGPKKKIDWPDFYNEAIELKGKTASEIVIEGREERF
ncbi:MAG: type II toxin-antitoxin system prevent-host-death family antitoxin [bacterium]|nr:type II toxin-antitoxin system prevent-host-death family antitoxin [bacterium]